MRDEFYKDMHAILLVFDICSKKSFENQDLWYKEAYNGNGKDCMFFLVGTKGDNRNTRIVRENDAASWAKMHNTKYFEVSAKSNTGVIEMIDEIISIVNK